MTGKPISPIIGTKQSFSATTTPINVVAIKMASGNAFRCHNHSTTDWANVFLTTDSNLMGATAGSAPALPFNKNTFGSQIPPGEFIDYVVPAIAAGQVTMLFTCWMDSGTATVVTEHVRI